MKANTLTMKNNIVPGNHNGNIIQNGIHDMQLKIFNNIIPVAISSAENPDRLTVMSTILPFIFMS